MVGITLTSKEWYFLHTLIEKALKDNPNNHIAKNILTELAENAPLLKNDVEFKREYECEWIKK